MSIQYKTINELSQMLKNKDISNKELIRETFNLIDANLNLNAFITLNKDASLHKGKRIRRKSIFYKLFQVYQWLKKTFFVQKT